MEKDKEVVQKMFDEISARTGMPRIDLSEDDSAALPFGEEMLLHIHYRGEIPEVDFTVPLGSVPRKKKAAVYERLLSANFYWVGTQGATLSYQDNLDEVIIQFREGTANLTVERLQHVMEGFLAVAMKWKERLAKLIENADEEDESDEEEDLDLAAGQGDSGLMLFEA
jgi:hypothetical protein